MRFTKDQSRVSRSITFFKRLRSPKRFLICGGSGAHNKVACILHYYYLHRLHSRGNSSCLGCGGGGGVCAVMCTTACKWRPPLLCERDTTPEDGRRESPESLLKGDVGVVVCGEKIQNTTSEDRAAASDRKKEQNSLRASKCRIV